MSARTFLGVLGFSFLAVVGAAGCGSTTETGTGGKGGGTSSSSGGGTTSTSTTGSASSTGASTSGSGGGKPCVDYTTPTPQTSPVNVRLVNKSQSDLYLGQKMPGCGIALGFTLEDASMTMFKAARNACEFTCGEMLMGSCSCPPDCGTPSVLRLAPGGHYDIGWTATVFEPGGLPASCYQEASCATNGCLNEVTPPPGPLTMRASAWSMPAGCSGPCGTCTPGTLGACVVPGATTVDGTESKGTVQWNGESFVEIDFM